LSAFDRSGEKALKPREVKWWRGSIGPLPSNGPDVHVYLVAAPDAKDDATVKNAAFVDLGSLKGNIGDQNYDVLDTVDLGNYRAVTIWCKRFSINFGTAPLAPTD
jgi:Electron transfer DM13